MILYVGDLHSKGATLKEILNYAKINNIKNIVQVGDFGIGFGIEEKLEEIMHDFGDIKVYTCGGNHDNWDMYDELFKNSNDDIKEIQHYSDVFWVRRGAVIEIDGKLHQFFGGATSTDKHIRTDKLDWWDREVPSKQEFDFAFENLEKYKPKIFVAHEVPKRVDIYRFDREKDYVANNLEHMFKVSNHHPKYYYFGHHHVMLDRKIEKTKFRCCGLHGEFWDSNGKPNLSKRNTVMN